MNKSTIIFDLDGTLLDTLDDLADAVNYALAHYGLPTHSYADVRMMVGNGVRNLMLRAVGLYDLSDAERATADVSPERFEEIFATFKAYYVGHCQVKTCIYDGLREVLLELRRRGCRLAIVSNKLQAGVTELQRVYFDGLIDVAIGEREGISRKPAPDMIDLALHELCTDGESIDDVRAEAVYVGDSDVDIVTARGAGMPCISVLWGFRDEAFLRAHGATLMAREPNDLLALLNC